MSILTVNGRNRPAMVSIERILEAQPNGSARSITNVISATGLAVVSGHSTNTEALLDLIDAQTVGVPTAYTITRNADGTLTLA